jgi:hypothetical protein
MRGRLGIMYPERVAPRSGSIAGVFDDLVKVDALASLITNAINACRTTDGRADEQDVGAYVIRALIDEAGAGRPKLSVVGGPLTPAESANVEAQIVDMMAARALGRLITEAIEKTQEPNGLTDTRKVAVYVHRAMKEAGS